MKYLSLIFILYFGSLLNAQVAIGKNTVDGDGILDFENPTMKGLLLPRVNAPHPSSVAGTLLFNVNTLRVEFKDNNGWLDFSSEEGSFDSTNPRYSLVKENPNAMGIVIGEPVSAAPGVLVLEATDKALILPKMENPHLTIKDPEAGMMAYDTVSKTLFLFNGVHWTVWGKK